MTPTQRPIPETLFVLLLVIGALVMLQHLAAGMCVVILVLAVYVGMQI